MNLGHESAIVSQLRAKIYPSFTASDNLKGERTLLDANKVTSQHDDFYTDLFIRGRQFS